jgi:hypothetical protein
MYHEEEGEVASKKIFGQRKVKADKKVVEA